VNEHATGGEDRVVGDRIGRALLVQDCRIIYPRQQFKTAVSQWRRGAVMA